MVRNTESTSKRVLGPNRGLVILSIVQSVLLLKTFLGVPPLVAWVALIAICAAIVGASYWFWGARGAVIAVCAIAGAAIAVATLPAAPAVAAVVEAVGIGAVVGGLIGWAIGGP